MEVKIKQTTLSSRTRTIEVDDEATTDEIKTIIETYGYDFHDDEDDEDITVNTIGFASNVGEYDDPMDSESWVDFEFAQYE